jgi:hypothetical protein
MLHRNAAQAAEDGPTDFSSGPPILAPPMELGADQKHNLHSLCDPSLRAAGW